MLHMADGMFLLAQMMHGCTQVIVPSFDAAAVARTITQEEVGVMLIEPTMIQMLIDHPQVETSDVSSLRRIVIVGDDGRELPRGSVGEIAARGPGLRRSPNDKI